MVDEGTGSSGSADSGPASAEDAFAEFVSLREAGEAPDFEVWIRRHPELDAELRVLASDFDDFDAVFRAAIAQPPTGRTLFHRWVASSTDRVSFVEFTRDKAVGDFRLVRRIGQGGMGEVWEAEQRSLGRRVALKFIRPDRVSERSKAYFDREARAGGRLNHAGLVTVHATGEDGGLHWIAQELVPGACDLTDFLAAQVSAEEELPADYFRRVAGFAVELCDALQCAHEAEVVHRDIKPHNILVTPDDHPKVTDFGLARLVDEGAFSGSYGLKGTPIYMSPEQAAGKTKLVDYRTDVYSLGAVLFEMLTLRRPFEGDSTGVLSRIQTEDPPDPRSLRPEVPAELAAVALRALEKRPADRYPTMRALGDDLRRYVNHEPVLARPPGPLRRAQKWVRRHPTAASVLGLGAVLAATVLVLGRQVQEAAERSADHQKQAILTRAWRRIDVGDLEGAAAEIDTLHEIFPRDLEGHLVMAAGYARSFRVTEMENELAALATGDVPSGPGVEDETSLGLYLEALRWLATEKGAAHGRVEENLERALALDADLEVAHFPLYQVRKALGDLEGAGEALAAYRGTLRTSDPNVQLVDALRAELDGDLDAARTELEALRAAEGDEGFSQLRGFRALGRILLQTYLDRQGAEATELEQASTCLDRAVADVPSDYSSWGQLATARLLQFDRTHQKAKRRALLDEAQRSAEHGLAVYPDDEQCRRALATVELRRLLLDFDFRDPPASAAFERVRAALAEVERAEPGHPLVDVAEAELLYREGEVCLGSGDGAGAAALFAESLEHNDEHLQARVMLGEIQYMRGSHLEALATFRAAEDLWDRRASTYGRRFSGGGRWGGRWIFAIYVWTLGAADQAGELDLAFDYGQKVRAELELNDELAGADVLTLAEFLALPRHAELRDCRLVRRLLEQHRLRETLAGTYGDLLDRIEQACR